MHKQKANLVYRLVEGILFDKDEVVCGHVCLFALPVPSIRGRRVPSVFLLCTCSRLTVFLCYRMLT